MSSWPSLILPVVVLTAVTIPWASSTTRWFLYRGRVSPPADAPASLPDQCCFDTFGLPPSEGLVRVDPAFDPHRFRSSNSRLPRASEFVQDKLVGSDQGWRRPTPEPSSAMHWRRSSCCLRESWSHRQARRLHTVPLPD